MTTQILEILSKDKEAVEFRKMFTERMAKVEMTKEEEEKAYQLMMAIMMKNNKEVMDIMATDAYNELRKA